MSAACAPVLVTGAGVLCATAGDVDTFSVALREGRSGIGRRVVSQPFAELRPALAADLHEFDLATAVERRPLAQRARALAGRAPLPVQASVAVALEAWERSGLADGPVPGERIGIIVAGHNLDGRLGDSVRDRYQRSPVYLPGRYPLQFMDTDQVGTVSELLRITGEGWTVGGASASGNVAIVNGCRLLATGEVDVCLVIGALTDLSDLQRQAFHNVGALACGDPATAARPFDTARTGFVPGQGAACLVLESAASAARREAPVWAAVVGSAARLDGNRLADPSLGGETGTMNRALRAAGLTADRIDLVSAHGTGSQLGDRTELAALAAVFGGEPDGPWINTAKGLIGHCLCAAGVVEAVAVLVQMRDGFVHPNANLRAPEDTGGGRLVGTEAVTADVALALSNSFGFGGFSTAVVFENRFR